MADMWANLAKRKRKEEQRNKKKKLKKLKALAKSRVNSDEENCGN